MARSCWPHCSMEWAQVGPHPVEGQKQGTPCTCSSGCRASALTIDPHGVDVAEAQVQVIAGEGAGQVHLNMREIAGTNMGMQVTVGLAGAAHTCQMHACPPPQPTPLHLLR